MARMSEPKSPEDMSGEELAATRDTLDHQLKHEMLTPDGRLELGQRLRDINAEIDKRAEVAEMQARYQS